MKFTNRNVFISPKARIGKNVKIGNNTTIYDNVTIEDNTIICNDCHIGEPLTDYYTNDDYQNPSTLISKNSLIRSHNIIYAGNKIGCNFITGHRVIIRINNIVGNNCSVGNETEIHGKSVIGNNVRLHSDVVICEHSNIGNYVWIAPGTILTNDFTPPSNSLFGPKIGNYTIIAVNVVTLPGVKIGKHCLLGASSLITKDVEDFSVMVGNPAKYFCDIRELKSKKSNKSHYPWPYNFSRGMPWEDIGYEQWLKEKETS